MGEVTERVKDSQFGPMEQHRVFLDNSPIPLLSTRFKTVTVSDGLFV